MRRHAATYYGIALFEGTFPPQIIAKLATTAEWLLQARKPGKPMPKTFRTETDAWAWIARQHESTT